MATEICDSDKSRARHHRARHHRSLKLGSKLKHLKCQIFFIEYEKNFTEYKKTLLLQISKHTNVSSYLLKLTGNI